MEVAHHIRAHNRCGYAPTCRSLRGERLEVLREARQVGFIAILHCLLKNNNSHSILKTA